MVGQQQYNAQDCPTRLRHKKRLSSYALCSWALPPILYVFLCMLIRSCLLCFIGLVWEWQAVKVSFTPWVSLVQGQAGTCKKGCLAPAIGKFLALGADTFQVCKNRCCAMGRVAQMIASDVNVCACLLRMRVHVRTRMP